MGKAKIIVLYDSQCSFCVAQMKALRRLDWFSRLTFLPASDSDTLPLSIRPRKEDLLEAIHCVSPSGQIFQGARCIRYLGLRLPLLVPLALILWFPGVIKIAERVYRRISRNRYLLSRFFGCKDACEVTAAEK
jgi:predicted DCC family thiol-disulfide oxidoreductase YuxK